MALERVDIEDCGDRLQIILHRARYDFVLARLPAGRRVLEIGTGPGTFTKELFPKCHSYVGVEFDQATCLEARRKTENRAEIIQADARQLPFADNEFSFIICLAPIIANTTQGLISVEANLVDLFLMHKATSAQILFKLRLPHALPNLFVGIRISAGIAVIGAIIGELFAGSNRVGVGGLGYSITYANSQLETDYLFALVFAATILGFTFFFIGMFLEWYFLHNWHESNRSDVPE